MATGLTDFLSSTSDKVQEDEDLPLGQGNLWDGCTAPRVCDLRGRGHHVNDTVGQEMCLKFHLMLILVYSSKPPKENQMTGQRLPAMLARL